jgi:hypothetical protein
MAFPVGVLGHGVRLDLLAVRTLLEVCSLFDVSCPHRVELAVGVLQMGRYDSELRSHPCPPVETCFSFSPPPHSTIHDTHW